MAYEYVLIACACAAMFATTITATPINKIANGRSLTNINSEKLQKEALFAVEDDFNESISVSAADDADAEEISPFSYSAKLEPEILASSMRGLKQKTDRKHKRIPRNVANVKRCPLHFIRKNGMCIPCQKLGAC